MTENEILLVCFMAVTTVYFLATVHLIIKYLDKRLEAKIDSFLKAIKENK